MSLEDIIPLTAVSFGSFYLLSISLKEINKALACNTEKYDTDNFLYSLFINGFMFGLASSACLTLILKKCH